MLSNSCRQLQGTHKDCLGWAQNIQQFRWVEERVNKELEKIVKGATREVVKLSDREDISLREAAFYIGVERVSRAIELRGFV